MAATVQAVIAARLDALPPELKAALPTPLSLARSSGTAPSPLSASARPRRSTRTLRELVVKQLVHRVRTSSMAGEREFAFAHALAREVAYGELPRAVRARKHAAAAAWIEAKAASVPKTSPRCSPTTTRRPLISPAFGDEELAASLLAPTIRHLGRAGERALRLDAAAAERHFARAVELAGATGSERLQLLPRWAQALMLRNRHREAVAALEEAIVGLQAGGDIRAAAVAMARLGSVRETLGEPREICSGRRSTFWKTTIRQRSRPTCSPPTPGFSTSRKEISSRRSRRRCGPWSSLSGSRCPSPPER